MTSNVQSTALKFVDPKTLMTIKDLELRARGVVQGYWSGIHRSPYHGFSVEFTEYRSYSQGDDPRFLDWRLFARSDRFYIKKFEDETNLRCMLAVDRSKSMDYGSRGYTKAEYANTLGATLAYFLYGQGDAVGALSFDEGVRDYLPARHRTGQLRHLMHALEKPGSGRDTDLDAPLSKLLTLLTKRGMVVVISDFLAPLTSFEKHLASLSASGHEVVIFQVLDPQEIDFAFNNPSIFQDLESEREAYIDPTSARNSYLRKFRAHRAQLQSICQRHGITFIPASTEQPLEWMLFEFLKARQSRKFARRR